MSMGLIGIGRQKSNLAMNGFSQVANMEQQRNQAEETLKANKEAADQSMKGTMVSTGAMGGAYLGMQAGSIGGPAGMAIGAAVGWLASSLF